LGPRIRVARRDTTAEDPKTSAYKQRIRDLVAAGDLEEAKTVYEEWWDRIENTYQSCVVTDEDLGAYVEDMRNVERRMLNKTAGWKPWPAQVLVMLPKPEEDLSSTEVDKCKERIFRLGVELVKQLDAFRRELEKLDELEPTNPSQSKGERLVFADQDGNPINSSRASTVKGTFENASQTIAMHAHFAREDIEGKGVIPMGDHERRQGGLAGVVTDWKSMLTALGRRPDRARARVAREYAEGWPNPITREMQMPTWIPTERDLALLSICYGCEDFPDGWEGMSNSELIGEEKRAMRHYLKRIKKADKKP